MKYVRIEETMQAHAQTARNQISEQGKSDASAVELDERRQDVHATLSAS